jgi:hypothetical protein
MKYLTTVLTLLLACLNVEASDCQPIYSNEYFYLCAEDSENEELFPAPAYDVYAVDIGTGIKSFISQEISINDVSKVTKVNETEYFYKAFIGGNSPPSEHRHVLIVLDSGTAKNAGVFSGYADIDNDKIDDYFLLKLSEIGSARAFDKYSKIKLKIQENKLVSVE